MNQLNNEIHENIGIQQNSKYIPVGPMVCRERHVVWIQSHLRISNFDFKMMETAYWDRL